MQSMGAALKDIQAMLNRSREIAQSYKAAQAGSETVSKDTQTLICRTCNDEEGYLVKDEDGYDRWKVCTDCLEVRKAARIMKQSNITDEFRKRLFKTFDKSNMPETIRTAWEAAGNYAKDFERIKGERRNSMALLGVPGGGKTHLCMAVSNHLIRQGNALIYFPWVEGFNELKNNLNELDERVGLLQRVKVLYIDDMWKGRSPTPFQLEQAFAIINYRYMHNLPLIISSEFDIDTMCTFDMAIGSRIFEMCKDFCVVIKGDPKEINYRLREDVSA